jgi:CheY-like chemotaxis protein
MAVVFQDDAGKPIRMIGTNYDISESKRIEEELRLANQSKDEFLSVMSHDLRSPLNPILGFTSLLLDDASEQEAEMLRHIQSSGQRMLSLVDSLLEYARLDRSAVTPSMRRFNLLKTCSSVFTEVSNLQSDLEGNLNNGGAGLLPLDEGLEVVSDPDIAARILVNLLQNAYKYTKQGHVTLTVGQKSDKGEFCFIIEDTGIGIDNAMIPALFEPFRQADSSYRRSQSGVGLGLAICNKLVGLLGGSISVSSELGVGSCFTLSFPMEVVKVGDSARENCHEPSQIKLQLTKALRVLLVDDQESNSLMAQIMVNRLGGKTTIASGGKEAIDLCEKELFDVILMDLQMPHLDGFQTSEHIRQEGGLNAKTPIFAVTANVSEENERKCLEIGMSGFLRKPITIEEIFDALSEFS